MQCQKNFMFNCLANYRNFFFFFGNVFHLNGSNKKQAFACDLMANNGKIDELGWFEEKACRGLKLISFFFRWPLNSPQETRSQAIGRAVRVAEALNSSASSVNWKILFALKTRFRL